jgi:hypothetical protein
MGKEHEALSEHPAQTEAIKDQGHFHKGQHKGGSFLIISYCEYWG